MAKFFNGVDLDVLAVTSNKILPQTDYSYCFYNSIFTTLTSINPLLGKLDTIKNASHMFDSTLISDAQLLDTLTYSNGAIIDYMFANTQISNLDDVMLPSSISSAQGTFSGCRQLTSAQNMNIAVNGSIAHLLENCTKLSNITGTIIKNATSIAYLLNNVGRVNPIPLVSTWNLSNCSSMEYAFSGCDVSGTIDFTGLTIGNSNCLYNYIFNGASNLNINLTNAKVNGGNIGGFGKGVSNYTINLTNVDLSANNDFTSEFENQTITAIDVTGVTWGSNVIFDKMFKNTKITSDFLLPLSVSSCKECFSSISTLKYISSNWKQTYANGIDPNNCYKNNTAITHVDGENKQAAYSSAMDDIPVIWGGYGFTDENTAIYQFEIPDDNYTLVLGRANSSSVAINWGDYSSTVDEYSHTYSTAGTYTIKTQSLLGTIASKPHTSVQNSLIKVLQFPTKFYDNDYNLSYMYLGCTKVTDINMSNIDLSNCISARQVFNDCSSLTTVNIDFTNTVLASGFAMYSGCTSLTKVTREMMPYITDGAGYQFSNCTSLREVEYVNGDKLHGMFQGCKNWETIGAIYIGSNHHYSLFGSNKNDTANLTNVTFYPYNNQLTTQDYNGFPTTIFQSANLTKESILSLFSILGTTTAGLTINLGVKQLARLTDEEKLIAINKGWSLA